MPCGRSGAGLALLLALSAGGSVLRADDSLGNALARSSPFLPAGQGVATAAAPGNSELEMRGVMAEGDSVRYWIYDPKKKRGAWLSLDEKGYTFAVVAADPERGTVSVRGEDGRTEVLTLHESKVGRGTLVATSASPGAGIAAPDTVQASEAPVDAPPSPDNDPKWKKLEEETQKRVLARLQALRNGQAIP